MIVETNNFRAVCHDNNIVYLSDLNHYTPKAGQCLHKRKVPILYNHNNNYMIGIAELRWCPDDCKIDAVCELNDNAKKCLLGGQSYSLDVLMTNLKMTSAGNIQNYIIREVSIVPHVLLPEHEEIIFKFLENPALRPITEIIVHRFNVDELKKQITEVVTDAYQAGNHGEDFNYDVDKILSNALID